VKGDYSGGFQSLELIYHFKICLMQKYGVVREIWCKAWEPITFHDHE